VTSKGHIAREKYQSTGEFVVPMPDRPPPGLGPPYWSFKYGNIKNPYVRNMRGFELVRLTTPYESVAFTWSHIIVD